MSGGPHAPLTKAALDYAWRQLARRAGVIGGNSQGTGFEGISLPVHYAPADNVPDDGPRLVVVPCQAAAWPVALERPPRSIEWLPVEDALPPGAKPPFDRPVPVLFRGAALDSEKRPFAEIRDGGALIIHIDLVAATFFMLSRWEETVVPTRDEHDRFPATASLAYRQGFLAQPVVDEYALIFRAWLQRLVPDWTPCPRQFTVKLSHDVDRLRRFPTLGRGLRALAGDLLKRREVGFALQTAPETIRTALNPQRALYYRRVFWLAELSQKHDLDSAFYFHATPPGYWDFRYDVSSDALRRCIDRLQDLGCEVGLHPGYDTPTDFARLQEEKARLDHLIRTPDYGGRQHYLRFKVPDTWRNWERVGLRYDTTMGYADYEGFRCGTCHPFRPFDLGEDRQLNLWEHPLVVMDGTLVAQRSMSPSEGEATILTLARRCKHVGGEFTLLWHNSSLDWEYRTWRPVYERVLSKLSAMLALR